MIGYIQGKILQKGEDFLIVEAGGIGYKVFVSEKTLEKIPKKQTKVELFVWPYLKRTTIELYGCLTQKEFDIFEALEGLPGIGPRTALSLASFGSLQELKRAIKKGDTNLTRIKGIGKKRLQRLMLELTGKLENFKREDPSEKDEVLQALLFLGFSKKEAKVALSEVSKNIENTQERLREALKILGKK